MMRQLPETSTARVLHGARDVDAVFSADED
jgi:hypothetical protein